VLKRAILLSFSGMVIGLMAALWLVRLIASQLVGVTPTDPSTFAGVAVFMMIVTVIACYVPARRATKVDPMIALRAE
jgi:ABC-type antimicrobial peptide transport system permease subunit